MAGSTTWWSPRDREILRLALPAFGALIAEPLFLLADSAIVGHLGTPPLAALGLAGTVLLTLVNLCVFLAYATTAAVARQLGAGRPAAALQHGVDGLWLALLLSVVLVAVGLPLAPTLVHALGASPEVAPHAETYLRISLLGIPPMLLVLAATGALRGLQDTRTPLAVAGAAAVVNLLLNLVLVYGAGLGIAGSAWGTVLTQAGAAGVYVALVTRAARRVGASLRPTALGMRAAAATGAALFVRTLTLRAALLVLTYVAARQGDVALAAHQVAFAVWTLLALALDAIAIAAQALVGRALGAADLTGTREATRRMVVWGVAAGLVLGLLVLALRPAYVPLFTPDPAVRAQLAAVLVVAALLQPLSGVVFVLDGVLIGAGDAAYLAGAGVVVLLAFLPLAALVLVTGSGLVALWWALGGLMLARAAVLLWRAGGDAWLVPGATRRRRAAPDPYRS